MSCHRISSNSRCQRNKCERHGSREGACVACRRRLTETKNIPWHKRIDPSAQGSRRCDTRRLVRCVIAARDYRLNKSRSASRNDAREGLQIKLARISSLPQDHSEADGGSHLNSMVRCSYNMVCRVKYSCAFVSFKRRAVLPLVSSPPHHHHHSGYEHHRHPQVRM
jgi:hypothetical protein